MTAFVECVPSPCSPSSWRPYARRGGWGVRLVVPASARPTVPVGAVALLPLLLEGACARIQERGTGGEASKNPLPSLLSSITLPGSNPRPASRDMGTLRIRYSVHETVQLDRALNRIAIQVDDFTEPLQASSDIIYAETAHQFATEGSPDWEPLSEAYARRKSRKFPGEPILRATHRLFLSLTTTGSEGSIHEITKDRLVIGSALMVGKWCLGLIHQLGAPRASIPARPMLRLRPSARTRIVIAFRDWLVAVARRMGVEVQSA